MAVYDDPVQAIREALPEFLELARIGVEHQKPGGGVLGYPSAVCLFAVVDAIGSYYRGHPTFTVDVDGKPMPIAKDRASDHILILNSEFFGFSFTEAELRALYRIGRSPLTHNALIGEGQWLHADEGDGRAIVARSDGMHVYLHAFHRLCQEAVERFLRVAADVITKSLAMQELHSKAELTYANEVQEAMAKILGDAINTPPVQVTAFAPPRRGEPPGSRSE
jgi:hypothetical protein